MIHRDVEPADMDEFLAALSIGEIPYMCPGCWEEKFFPNMTQEDANLYFRVMASGEWDAWPTPWMGRLLQVKLSDLSGPMFRQLIKKAELQCPIPHQGGGIEHIAKYGPYYYGVVSLPSHYFASDRSETGLYLIRAKSVAPIFAMVTEDLMISEAMGELHQVEKETETKFPVKLMRAIVDPPGKDEATNKAKDHITRDNSIDNVMRAIHEWVKGHGNNVIFHGGFAAFDEEGNVIDDRILCYGYKPTLQISIEEFVKEFDKEEEDFVNW